MWYQNVYRRHLCDMHITDWDDSFFSEFSPEQYVENLKLAKVQTAKGKYKYVVGHSHTREHQVKFNRAVVDSIISVDYACNTVVLKTYPGLAMAVASGVDSLNLHDILGCVGGDDTILIITRDEESASRISEEIRELMRAL